MKQQINKNLGLGILFGFLIIPHLSKSQIKYDVPPLLNYFSIYKNGKSIDVLNDSIKTSFYKFSDSAFSIKIYVNDKFEKECPCLFRGAEKKVKAKMLELKNGKKSLKIVEFMVRQLDLKDRNCFDFLPNELLKK
jgi:hypothetical protein